MSQLDEVLGPSSESLTGSPSTSESPGPPSLSHSPVANSHPNSLDPSPPLSNSGRPQRVRHLPARYRDIYPEPPTQAISTVAVTMPMQRLASDLEMPLDSEAPMISQRRSVSLIVFNRFRTAANNFGLWKDYLYCPSYDPDAVISTEDLYRPHLSAILPQQVQAEVSLYTNKTIELLLNWQNSGSSAKSNDELNRLVKEVLFHPKFKRDELQKFNATRENQKADAAQEQSQFL